MAAMDSLDLIWLDLTGIQQIYESILESKYVGSQDWRQLNLSSHNYNESLWDEEPRLESKFIACTLCTGTYNFFRITFLVLGGVFVRSMMNRLQWKTGRILQLKLGHKVK